MRRKREAIDDGSDVSAEILPKWWERSAIALSGINAVFILLEIYSRSKKKKWQAIFIIEFIRLK